MSIQSFIFLSISIILEVIATSSLRLTESFTKFIPSLTCIICYSIAFWCLTFPLREVNTGIVYAIWSGCGIIFVCAAGWLFFNQKLDFPAIAGLLLIISGVIVINIFSHSASH